MGKPLIVVLGAGLGGTIASYEIKAAVKGRAEVMTVSDTDTYSFIPSNPWVAVRWREPEAIRVHQTLNAERDQAIAQLRADIQSRLPAAPAAP